MMLATRIALLAGVAALVGCSSTAAPDNTTRSAGITQAVAAGFAEDQATNATNVNLRNAVNGEQVTLTITDAVPAQNGVAGTPATATLVGAGAAATPSLALEQTSTSTSTPNGFAQPVTTRTFNAAAADPNQSSLTVMDAEYARVSSAILSADTVGGQQGRAFTVGPVALDTERAVPTNGTATYSGVAQGSAITTDGVEAIDGTMTLNADFGAGTVNGTVDTADTLITLQQGRITGNDYAGAATLTDNGGNFTYSANGVNDRSAYRGGFYGPEANETAGVVDFAGTRTDAATGATTRLDAFGNYIAAKQ